MSQPDRSNLASFYDPDHPDNHLMPVTDDREYWVEITCTAHTHGWGGYAHDAESAMDKAWADAKRWGYGPAEVKSCEVME